MFTTALILATAVACCSGFLVPMPPAGLLKAPKAGCDEQRSVQCFQEFVKLLDVPMSVEHADEFIAWLTKMFKENGKNELVKLCSAVGMLHYCEGDQYDECTSFPGFSKLGMNDTDAYAYTSTFGYFDYQCGPGYDVYYNNLACMLKVDGTEQYRKYSAECTETFTENAKKDPLNVCEYFQSFTVCLVDPFAHLCGKPVAHARCMATNSGFKKIDPQCHNLNCDYLI